MYVLMELGVGLARFTVPPIFRPALAKLSTLPAESAEALLSAINSTTPVVDPKKMVAQIGSSVPAVSTRDLESLLSTLFALASIYYFSKPPLETFVEDVSESALVKRPSDIEHATLKERLTQFLHSRSLVLAAKASALQREHPRVLLEARIFTDLRPVFGAGPEEIQGALVVHTMKLECIENSERREFFVALDDSDLAMLQKTCVRAEAKSKALRVLVDKLGITDLDAEQQ